MPGAVQDCRELPWREPGQGAGEIAAHQKVQLGVVQIREGTVRGCGAGWVVEALLRGLERRVWKRVGSGERDMGLEQRVMDAVAGIFGIDVMGLAVAKPFEFAGGIEFFVGRHAMSG